VYLEGVRGSSWCPHRVIFQNSLFKYHIFYYIPPPHGPTAFLGQGLLIVEVSKSHTHTHTRARALSAGLLRTSDRPVAETSTWQSKTLTKDRYQCPRRDSNPRPQTHSLDCTATGIRCIPFYCTLLFFLFFFLLFSEFHLVCFAALNGHEGKICIGMYSCYFKGNNRNS